MSLLSFFSRIKRSKISSSARVYPFSVVKDSEIGNFSYISYNCVINNSKIGKFCSIARNVKIGLGMHPTNFISTSPVFYSPSNPLGIKIVNDFTFEDTTKVTIGNDVWIVANVVVLDGASIDDVVIVGANTIVNKDVPPYSIVGGVPARLIRKRFTDDIINILIKLEWWDLPLETIRKEQIMKIFSKELSVDNLKKLSNILKAK